MATVDGMSAAKMQEIADASVVEGHVDGDTLILTARDGTQINAGYVRGPQGDPALPTNLGEPVGTSATPHYVRVGVIDGTNDSNGAQLVFDFNGGSNFGEQNVYSAKVHVGQRGPDNIKVEIFEKGNLNTKIEWYTRKLSTYVFEIWVRMPGYSGPTQLQPLVEWNGDVTYDSQPTAPGSLLQTNVEVFQAHNDRIVKALLDPMYRGPGPARVHFLPGGALTTEAYQWEGKPIAYWGNRVVNMKRKGSTWVIVGETGEEGYGGKVDMAPNLLAGWIPYSWRNAEVPERWGWPRIQRLHSGIVVMSGLIGYGTSTAGTIIAMLPPVYRPDTDIILPINNGDTAKTICIRANGEIRVEGGNWVANTYISLDGLAWPAAGVASWTDVASAGSGSAFVNGWIAHDPATWGPPRYWRDPYGFVWFQGIIKNGSMAGDDYTMISLPTTHQQYLKSHVKAANNAVFGFISAIPGAGNGLHWKSGSQGGNAWLSISSVINVTSDAVAGNNWMYPFMLSGWQRYSTQFPPPALLRRADGLGMAMGLMNAGTNPPVKLTSVPANLLPEAGAILYGVSNDAFNRQDIVGLRVIEDATSPGRFTMNSGANSWNSWDSHVWMVGD